MIKKIFLKHSSQRLPKRWVVLLAALVLWFAAGMQGWAARVDVIELDNQIISPVTQQYIENAIGRAEAEGATCLVIRLDTPGGLLESTRAIVRRMMNARVPIVVYVAPSGARAGSAGVFITLAAHVAAMAPSTNIGAAHPVMIGEGGDAFRRLTAPENDKGKANKKSTDPMTEKIINDTVAWITGIARTRGRNEDWARRAVTESVSVGETEALREHIIDLVATDTTQLLEKINGRPVTVQGRRLTLATAGATVVTTPMSARQHFLALLVNPNVAYLLMMFGVLGLIFEFTHPGLAFPGIGGIICLLLALYAFQTLPVNFAAVLLIGLGLSLLIAEALVISHGLLALGGIVALVLGSLMLFESPEFSLRVSLGVIGPMVVTMVAIILFLMQRAVRSRSYPVATGAQGLVGTVGEAVTDLTPEGRVYAQGTTWGARATVALERGAAVRIVAVEGLRLIVEPVTPQNNTLENANDKGEG